MLCAKPPLFCPILNKIIIRRHNYVKKMKKLNVTKIRLVGVALFRANTRRDGFKNDVNILSFFKCT